MHKIIKKWLLLSALPALMLSSAAWSNFDQAMNYYEHKDYLTASSEFKKLAAQGDADAQYMLGYMYAVGRGVIQDYIEAHKWFNLAASRGNSDALKARTSVERKMTPEQISKAQQKARDWTPQRYQAPLLTAKELQSVNNSEPELKDKHSISITQYQLTQLGYKPGAVDGAMGNNTRKAIRQYQADQQLSVDGRITRTLLGSLYPDGAPDRKEQVALTEDKKLLFPDIWLQPKGSDKQNTEQLRTELQQLLLKGRQRQAARDWFLNELEGLINPPASSWSTIVLEDNFEDGNYTQNPRWTVMSGKFSVNSSGLHSSAVQRTLAQKKASEQDISTAILGVILEHATGTADKPKASDNSSHPGQAKIYIKKNIPSSFALKVELSLSASQGRVELGPYIGSRQQQAYQLLLLPEQSQIQLLRVNGYKSSVIESVTVDLPVNNKLLIEWLRDDSGLMRVALNGKQLFKVADRYYKTPFSGFMLSNYSTNVNLSSLKILAK